MRFNRDQIDILSKYLADLSKILFGSTVLGFFLTPSFGPITLPVFIFGCFATMSCLIFSVRLLK